MKTTIAHGLVAMGLVFFSASGAYARSGGISGFSGNPTSCTACHSGGTVPTVSFIGPTSVAPGSTTQYIFRVSGLNGLTAGVDISAVGGTLQNLLNTTRILNAEIVQNNNLAPTNGVVDISFNVVAPASGTVKLYASGMSANGMGTGGSGTKTSALSIAVAAPVANMAPVANAGGPYSVAIGTPVNFDGSLSKDPDGTISAYAWDFGDGTKGTGAKVSHSYLATGVYNVALTVTDNLGLTGTIKTTATVNPPANMLPVANAGGPYTALIAVPVNFDGSLSKDPDGTIVSYAWDFGDGAMSTGAKVAHAYAKEGTYTATLTVTDNLGATGTAKVSVLITLANMAPVANAGGPYTPSRRGRVVFDGTASTDADGKIVSFSWDFGDGTTGSRARMGHVYSAPGAYTAILTVTDDAGATSQAKVLITIP